MQLSTGPKKAADEHPSFSSTESVLLDNVGSGTVGLPYYYLYPFIIDLCLHGQRVKA